MATSTKHAERSHRNYRVNERTKAFYFNDASIKAKWKRDQQKKEKGVFGRLIDGVKNAFRGKRGDK